MPRLLAPATPSAHAQNGSPPDRRPLTAPLAVLLLVLVGLLVAVPAPALAMPPQSVSITDTTGRVDAEQLAPRLSAVDFRTEVDLVVLVLDVTDLGGDASQDLALNDAVLTHARDSAPELLSEDGQHFADDTVILALDPGNRFLGTYAGEDVKLDEDGFDAVQDAMREDAAEGRWEDTIVAGAQKYAALLDRPWWQHPASIVGAVAAVIAAVVGLLSALGLRAAARRRMDESLPRYQDVLAQRSRTDAAARELPTTSPYARAALSDYEQYRSDLVGAEQLFAQLPSPSQRRWGWGLRGGDRRLSREFAAVVASLDDADDALIATRDLLHRRGEWRRAWEQELQPLRDSIAALDDPAFAGEDMSTAEAAAAADLRELGGDVTLEMESLTAQLRSGGIEPDAALERLDTLTRELSAAAARLQHHRVDHLAADDNEREVLKEAAASDDAEEQYRSVRARRHAVEHSTSGTFWNLSPLLWYSSWHHRSDAALEAHRNPSSSSTGSSSGFSSSGFSGAGSSSRF